MKRDYSKWCSVALIAAIYAIAGVAGWLLFEGLAANPMTALFLGISIPLMEKRQLANKPDYAEYRKQTRILI